MFKLLQVKGSTSETVQIITAIGNAWQVLLILVVVTVFIVYRKKIIRYFSKFNKVSSKTPIVEFNLEREGTSIEITELIGQEKEASPQSKTENSKSEILEKEEASFYLVYEALKKGDIRNANSLFQQIQEKESDLIEKEKNTLFLLSLKYHYSSTNTISEIEKIANSTINQEIKFKAYQYLGECYSKAKNFIFAQTNFEIAFTNASLEEDKVTIALHISDTLFESGKKEEAINYLKKIKDIIKTETLIAQVFVKLASYFDKDEDWLDRCLALELAVSNDPNNTTILFEAAYVYSNRDKDDSNKFIPLSILHYKDMVSYKPNSVSALNNLGVSYSELGLSSKSIQSYKKAVELKNTLATANLANLFINIGCFEEALEILNKVKEYENVHENVWNALKRITENVQVETEKEDKILKDAKINQIYLREFAQLYFSSNASLLESVDGTWKVNGNEVEYKQLPNPDYYEFKWSDLENKFTISINIKKASTNISDGEYVKHGRYASTKVNVFSIIVNAKSMRLLLYDKSNSIGFHLSLTKE